MDASCILPYDVLVNIFQYLPLNDRKSVRLTCRLWNDSCHHPTIVKREKFVFHPGITRGDMMRTGAYLAKCRTLRSYFEFYALIGTEIPPAVWTECGDRITSLFFNESAVDNETLKNVLLSCPNLISLRIISLDLIHNWKADCLNFRPMFTDLIRLGVKRENLISFELFISTPMVDEDVEKLFRIHPKIRTFRHGCWLPDLNSDNIFLRKDDPDLNNSHHLDEELLRFIPIENFTFNWWMDFEWIMSYPDLGVKFKEFEVAITFEEELTVDDLIHFFSNQTELEKLSLHVADDIGTDFFAILLPLILKKLPKLKILRFHVDFSIDLEVSKFVEFLNLIRNLESVDVSLFRVNYLDSPMELLSPSPPQKFINLKTLRLKNEDEQIVLQILQRCSSCLSTLHLSIISDQILQTIFEHHTKLKELHFCCGLQNCTATGITGQMKLENNGSPCRQSRGYSFARLQNLEHLAFSNQFHSFANRTVNSETFAAFLSEFDFPHLKHLEFDNVLNIEEEHQLLRTVSIMAPCLETLEMRPKDDGLDLALLIRYCWRLKRLKCVKFVSRSSVDLYEQLFTECPSLINVFTRKKERYKEFLYSVDKIFFYDRISKTLTSVQ